MNEIRDILLGLDFGRENCQLSYFDRKLSKVQNVPVKVGSDSPKIPTKICRRKEKEDYCIGKEAEYFAEEKGETLISNLYEICEENTPVEIDGQTLLPSELLAEYIRELLKFTGLKNPISGVKAIGICVEALHEDILKNLQEACELLGLEKKQIHIMDYGESFYYYVMAQKLEVRNRYIGWFDFKGEKVYFKRLAVNSYVKPVMVRLEGAMERELPEAMEERDLAFYMFIQETLRTDVYTSIQITGQGFEPEHFEKSVKSLCKNNRKVYAGENLFSYGACEAVREKTEKKQLKGFLYVSESLVTVNVGMDMIIKGALTYYPIIQAGKNWYECNADFEMILDRTEELVFQVQEMGQKNRRQIGLVLPGLPERPDKTTRLHVSLTYRSPKICNITIRDMGFGDLYPASDLVWNEAVEW